MLDILRRGEREVVETVCLVIFSIDFLEERPGVQPERERSQSCSFGARKGSDTEIKDAFEGKYKVDGQI